MAGPKPSKHSHKLLLRIEPRLKDWLARRAYDRRTTITEEIRTAIKEQIARVRTSDRDARRQRARS